MIASEATVHLSGGMFFLYNGDYLLWATREAKAVPVFRRVYQETGDIHEAKKAVLRECY